MPWSGVDVAKLASPAMIPTRSVPPWLGGATCNLSVGCLVKEKKTLGKKAEIVLEWKIRLPTHCGRSSLNPLSDWV